MRTARPIVVLLTLLAVLLAVPTAFADTLVDQTAATGTGSAISEEGASPADYNGESADDVVVPAGAQWTVTGVQTSGLNYGGRAAQPVIVRFYADASGTPGAESYKQTSTISTVDPHFAITLATPAVLGPGRHWLSVQVAGSDGTSSSEWFWLRGAASGAAALFRNSFAPGPCATWAALTACQGQGGPDLRFALTGTSGPAPTTPPAAGGSPVTPPTAPAAVPTPPGFATGAPISFAKLVKLPSARRCLSRRQIAIKLTSVTGTTVTKATVQVTGKPVRTITGKALRAPVDLRGLPKGRFVVKLTVKLADGKTLSGKRTYRTCAPKPRTRAR